MSNRHTSKSRDGVFVSEVKSTFFNSFSTNKACNIFFSIQQWYANILFTNAFNYKSLQACLDYLTSKTVCFQQPKKTKKFIDKKNAVTFHLVHRSQQDPLAADERAPQKVLLPVNTQPKVT